MSSSIFSEIEKEIIIKIIQAHVLFEFNTNSLRKRLEETLDNYFILSDFSSDIKKYTNNENEEFDVHYLRTICSNTNNMPIDINNSIINIDVFYSEMNVDPFSNSLSLNSPIKIDLSNANVIFQDVIEE